MATGEKDAVAAAPKEASSVVIPDRNARVGLAIAVAIGIAGRIPLRIIARIAVSRACDRKPKTDADLLRLFRCVVVEARFDDREIIVELLRAAEESHVPD
jgi:hypothetical protein